MSISGTLIILGLCSLHSPQMSNVYSARYSNKNQTRLFRTIKN